MSFDIPASPVSRMVDEWLTMREELRIINEEEISLYADITDRFGRTWVYSLYDGLWRHMPCGLAWTENMIRAEDYTLPTQAALDNPNYQLCDICIDGRTRNITPCKPEWDCPHAVCEQLRKGGLA